MDQLLFWCLLSLVNIYNFSSFFSLNIRYLLEEDRKTISDGQIESSLNKKCLLYLDFLRVIWIYISLLSTCLVALQTLL